jgi:hypothetical protein
VGPTARRALVVGGGILAIAVSGYLVWVAVTGLSDDHPNAWIYVVALALVPWLLAFAVALPAVLAAQDNVGRTHALFAPLPAALFSLGLFVCTVALAVEIDSAVWSTAVVVCGAVLALENFGAMRRFHDVGARRAVERRPTPRRVGLFAARMALFLTAFVLVVGSIGEVLLGRTGLLLALGVVGVGLVWSIVTAARSMRRTA